MARYQVLARYRRTVSALAPFKRLLPVVSLADEPVPFGEHLGDLCPGVVFYLLEDHTGARFWARRWLGDRIRLTAPTRGIESFLATLGRDDLCLAVDADPRFGLIYRYDEDLFASATVLHACDWEQDCDAAELAVIRGLAAAEVRWPRLPRARVGTLTDFQVARTSHGLVCLDFEPSARYAAELAGVVIR